MKRIYLSATEQLSYSQIRERREKIQFEKTKFYVNRFPSDVYIRDRSGLMVKIAPTLGGSAFRPDRLYICEYISCTPDILNSYDQQARNTSDSMRQYMHRAVLQHWSAEPPVRDKFSVEVFSALSLAEITGNDGVVYLEELDIVVMYGLNEQTMNKMYHPYSLAGYAYSSYQQVSQNNPHIRHGDFTFNLRIVDNEEHFGSRWILIDDEPFCIVASKDAEVTDGIYITRTENTLGGKGSSRLLVDRIEFKNSDTLPYYKLYTTRQEALANSRSILVEEAQAKVKELTAKVLLSDNALEKARQEQSNLERETKIRREKFEQEMEKIKRDNERLEKEHDLYVQKQAMEQSSLRRKNTAELIKCVPILLSTVAVGMSLFKKKKA